MKKATALLLSLLIMAGALSACSSGGKAGTGAAAPESGGISLSGGSGSGSYAVKDSAGDMPAPSLAPVGEMAVPAVMPAPRPDERPYEPAPEPQAGMLTAAEWNDNEHFEFFTDVLGRSGWKSMQDTWRIYPLNRVAVRVTDPQTQEPVKGASVVLMGEDGALTSAVTDYSGRAWLYYDLSGHGDETPVRVTAEKGGVSAEAEITEGETSVELNLAAPEDGGRTLDLMFVVDTTGSMGDELEYLKTELRDVIHRVAGANEGLRIRLSVNFYRDEGDEYVVRPFDFTESVNEVVTQISKQYSDGGGDTPEAVEQAFKNALDEHDWSKESVKLMFFVLDAPPHADKQSAPTDMRNCMTKAAEMGIRVIPIVCSGDSYETEYLMRTAAAVSGGTYAFLTDDSGIGNSHLEPTVGEYQVEQLNALMTRLINKYCA
ncbi:MAG: VWA domain-containing protein [Oscillospiraceae bacterium]|nr:VWA domain-containing protein [Oscillospiraceae bacterium]